MNATRRMAKCISKGITSNNKEVVVKLLTLQEVTKMI
ncbi:hypothetical protein B0H41_003566 [Clostridium beijerinckii]|uniref:Uncharacterized protein n=1 Tax=Clostridium beijerinckii TaxID=1520 RepID=A0AAX0B478_CLOBE|nr:hypothetical protein [Clostridium beijerinckii]